MTRALVTSTCSDHRLEQARAFLRAQPCAAELTIVANSLEAGAELTRPLRQATFGWERTTLYRLAVSLARPRLVAEGRALASSLAVEALWARVVHELGGQGQLGRLMPLADKPGLAGALARSATEVRLAGVAPHTLEPALAGAVAAYLLALDEAKLADRALVLQYAALAPAPARPLVLLDVAVGSVAEANLVAALGRAASAVLATAPRADHRGVSALAQALGCQARDVSAAPATALGALQHNLFDPGSRAIEAGWSDLISAPGEAREAVEIARTLQAEARRGVPFDQMAVLLRAPAVYRAPIEAAFRRAGIEAWFARGTPSPDPAARALLALLKCAEEGLSARRFSEYLSLGQVPRLDLSGAPPEAASSSERFVAADGDELVAASADRSPVAPAEADEVTQVDAPVVAGALRAPRRWEHLLVDAAVIGGSARWKRRLEGLEALKRKERSAPDLSEGKAQHLDRELGDLQALQAFALPMLEELSALPARAPWGEWLERLSALASRALKQPQRVQAILAELAPMAVVGPVDLREVRAVLSPRLSEFNDGPGERRAGKVFVGPIDAARGLSFEVVCVPGLVERVFPQKLREDPLLTELARAQLGLTTNVERVAAERLALQLSVGAARRRAVLSYPRVDAEHARPRVPSFYALEAMRAVEGRLPGFSELQRRAEVAVHARLGWPAPRDATLAIDDTEYDLAVLDGLLRATDGIRGKARYLLQANPHLARALRSRYARWSTTRWTPFDGLVSPPPDAQAALVGQQLTQRAFSPTALQHYAACPYRFYLSAIVRLHPLEIPEAIEQLGPLERGSLSHEVQFKLLSRLRDEGFELSAATLAEAFGRLDQVLAEVAGEFKDTLFPAIARVWDDGIEALRADLREWLRRAAVDGQWQPWRFELSFGLGTRPQQDPASVPEPVELDVGVRLRGSIDLVELSARGTLRATDYKTGRARAEPDNIVGGGRALQPVLYALTVEKLIPDRKVEAGRLYYCSQAGGFSEVATPLDSLARASMQQVVGAIGQGLSEGFLPAAPDDGECRFCDFRAVCGPDEQRRTRKKRRTGLEALDAVRRLP